MRIPQPQMELLKQLIVGSIRRENYKPNPVGDALLKQKFAEFHDFEGIVFFAITPEGRAAYAAQINRQTDQEDASEDAKRTNEADPGPAVRMAAHVKEAGMIAFRLGVNSVRAGVSAEQVVSAETVHSTLRTALGASIEEHIVDSIALYLVQQLSKGIAAGQEANRQDQK